MGCASPSAIATSCKITTALNFKVGEVALNLQTGYPDKIIRLFFHPVGSPCI